MMELAGECSSIELASGSQSPEAVVRPQRRQRVVVDAGKVALFFIWISLDGGLWHAALRRRDGPGLPAPEATLEGAARNSLFLAGAVAARWRLVEPGARIDEDTNILSRWMLQQASRCHRGGIRGWVIYEIIEATALEGGPLLLDDADRLHFDRLIKEHPRLDNMRATLNLWSQRFVWDSKVWAASLMEPVTLTARLAQVVVDGTWACLHAIAIGRKLRRRHLLHSKPSPRTIRRFIRGKQLQDPFGPINAIAESRRAPRKRWRKQAAAADVLAWIEATGYIRSLHEAWKALRAFGKILFRKKSKFAAAIRMVKKRRAVCRETLRRSRVRLDCVTMLLHRVYIASVKLQGYSVYLYCDTSPQWRGLETYASSWDLKLKMPDCLQHRQTLDHKKRISN